MDFTYSPIYAGASFPYFARIFSMADPTMAPSDRSAMVFACSGVEIPKPIATGTFAFSRITRISGFRSVVISLRVPVTPRLDTR